MTWPATARYELESAPGGLGLVQDLLNTVAAGAPRQADLLSDLAAAQAWVDDATAQWSAVTGQPVPQVALDADGLDELRAFRDELHRLTTQAREDVPETESAVPVLHSATAALQLGEDGLVRLESRGTGWRRLASLVLVAAFEGQRADTRRRLKTCRNPRCRAAFYDRSRNNSGVWHDVKTCGNAANLRAYRARQRVQNA
ncbi:CGNR zinc finger domain-containing protein [Kitasatospora sp. GP82]|uniref:CGNR zinc finger domain-containing protein n=1 Tax=Kitasatospora sp. GP82 TaxID=3035089 RepID=UPI0024761C41|nr:CGNR zinc finger domain-containing protein [Kitasatospora sp. GP82]MDH6126513.1 putative RNA-binding Zn ribbon-like protein [Kitasatospora sp. GP82]